MQGWSGWTIVELFPKHHHLGSWSGSAVGFRPFTCRRSTEAAVRAARAELQEPCAAAAAAAAHLVADGAHDSGVVDGVVHQRLQLRELGAVVDLHPVVDDSNLSVDVHRQLVAVHQQPASTRCRAQGAGLEGNAVRALSDSVQAAQLSAGRVYSIPLCRCWGPEVAAAGSTNPA